MFDQFGLMLDHGRIQTSLGSRYLYIVIVVRLSILHPCFGHMSIVYIVIVIQNFFLVDISLFQTMSLRIVLHIFLLTKLLL